VSALIELSDLLVFRGDQPALELDRLAIERGEVLAVVGPNGAGKSTLLLTLARLLEPQRGSIQFGGQAADSLAPTEYRRRLALVMQEPLLFDTSVIENAAMGLRFRGVSKEAIQRIVPRWLKKTGVAHLANKRASEISGGEAQRVSLARALVLEPELLLLDEPFAALDPPTREAILQDLASLLGQTKTTTVFTTHDLREAEQLSDRMAVIIGGRLRQVGRIEDLDDEPADDEVARFLNHRLPPPRNRRE
jgi:tungstate transport system ATP-binding protein